MKFFGLIAGCAATVLLAVTTAAGESVKQPPTHIIKFKNHVNNGTTAYNFIVSKHLAYLQKSMPRYHKTSKNDDDDDDEDEGDDGDDNDDEQDKGGKLSAASLAQQLSLDSITLDDGFIAMAGVFQDPRFIQMLYEEFDIEYVEPNQIYKVTHIMPYEESELRFNKRDIRTAVSPDWGLSRISQRLNENLEMYTFDDTAGSGIDVYVVDTGVYIEHTEFEGRATHDSSFVPEEDITDLGGHGTHVAAKIAGKVYGVAKAANIRSVKILNQFGDGSTNTLLKAFERILETARPGKSIINLSLSGPRSRVLDDALNKIINERNIPVFVSAGNMGVDACYFTPSSNPNVFAVGATDINDNVANFSNTGECVALYAPGVNIKSASHRSPEEYAIMHGTSMANPYVSGIAAALMSKNEYSTAKQVYDAISSAATVGVVSFYDEREEKGSTNLLAYMPQ